MSETATPHRDPAGARLAPRSRVAAAGALIAVVVLVLYGPTLSYGLIEGEDRHHLDYVSGLLDERGLVGFVLSDYRQNPDLPLGYYRPLIQFTFLVDQAISTQPWVFHLDNVLAHLTASLLLLWLLMVLFERLSPALLGALLFAAHPIQTECVAFMAARTDPWVAVFLLPASITWLRVRRGLSSRPALETLVGALCFTLAMLTKEVAWVAPAVLLVWDVLLPGGSLRPSAWLRRNVGWLAAWGSATLACLGLRVGLAGTGFGPGSTGLEAGSLPDVSGGLLVWLGSMLTRFKLLVWPWPMRVAYLDETVRLSPAIVFGAALLLVVLAAAAHRGARRGGLLGLAWIAVFLAPVSGFVSLASYHLHERFLYIPSIGLSIAVAGLVLQWQTSRRAARVVWSAVAVVLPLFAVMTTLRASVWKNDESLWTYTVESQPRAWVGHFYLAKHHLAEGRTDDALAGYRRAIERVPDFAPAHLEIGFAYAAAGRHQEALAAFLEARRLNTRLPLVNSNLAVAYRNLGQRAAAARAFRAELDYRPGDPEVHYNLAAELLFSGDPSGALAAAESCLGLAPAHPDAHNLRGVVLVSLGRIAEARDELAWLERNAPAAAYGLRQALAASAP